MKYIDRVQRLEHEIENLIEVSENLRDQIALLENKESKLSDEILTKKRQLTFLKSNKE